MIRVALLPGDGIGEEVLDGPARLLRRLAADGAVEVTGPWPVGARAAAATGDVLPAETLAACDAADAVLLGAVGEDPRVPDGVCPRPEVALHRLRERYDLRISVRDVPFRDGTELTVVRNLIGGSYGGADDRWLGEDEAADVLRLTRRRIAEVVHTACDVLAQRSARSGVAGRLVSVDKANLYVTGRLWRQVAGEVARERGVDVEHRYVDRAAYELGSGAAVPDVLVTEGLLGDILSDLAAGRAGSPALCGSASVHPGEPVRGRCVGLFEPAHGSAPRRALRGQVDPLGGFLALAALLRHFPATRALGDRVRAAVDRVLQGGPWTYDLAPEGTPPAPTGAVADAVLAAFDDAGGPAVPVAVEEPPVRVPADVLAGWTTAVLTAVGVRRQHAGDVARVLGYADLSGIDSHGVARLPAYVRGVRAGAIATDGEPTVSGEGAVALVDGHGLLGHPVTTLALAEAVHRAREHGVGWVNVRDSSHHGASGAYVFEAAAQGLVGLAATNTGPVVAPAGGARPYLGTNPLALGVPVAGEKPMVFDMATSAVAAGKFEIALRAGRPVPLGWGVDADGRPTTDPAAVFPGRGALLPLGSDRERSVHKGYGLALLVEVLTAVLGRGPTGPGVGNLTFRAGSGHPGVSHLVVVLDPGRLGDPAELSAGAARLLAGLRALAPVDPERPVRTPGQRAAAERALRRVHGVPLDAGTHRALQELAGHVGRPLGVPARA
ncbi:Malate/lactate/ureidoglycolate dehydrogenase, LDH2 family [Geodermatophilus pulveris]|uniref:Malate/lactate/ureidoglycolate dehydrogenase, LDH2 family n=1 Tax=Geodermatophilus pulveris TaxID=1564159 RepID=A0A239I757_9ACTN|nr:Ldh family oxidoreductase [Geodermatophilus pulveris]SNS89128.1 Malate/lactate/ureidoglycolate dehydrogenase, LDH2 family [Geodermatophilus pulveris]